MASTWRMRLKTRCVDCTDYDKTVQHTTTGNSMVEYAREMLALNGSREIVKGNTMAAA